MLKFLDHTKLENHTQPVGLLWTSDQLIAEVAIYTAQNKLKGQTSVYSAVYKPAIPETKRLQTNTSDRMAIGFDLKTY